MRRYPALALISCSGTLHAGVLLDYGTDYGALNDAGVIRSADNPGGRFGFSQFQIFNIDPRDPAWQIDRVTVHFRAWNNISTGEASLAIYRADGLEPDLLEKVSADFALRTDTLLGEAIRVDLDGLVLEHGSYFVGVEAAEPTSELLWLAGDDSAFRTSRRSDGEYFSASPRALSLSIDGTVVPAVASPGLLALGLLAPRRRGR